MTAVVVKLTDTITLQITDQLDTTWKATCPLGCDWKTYKPTRRAAQQVSCPTHSDQQGNLLI